MLCIAFKIGTVEAVGVIQQVDVLGRSLTVLVSDVLQVFDLLPDCAIILHGERIKLRLVQPLDYARVIYSPAPEGLLACSVDVNGWFVPTPNARDALASHAGMQKRFAPKPAAE
jgi:hypothetical protein